MNTNSSNRELTGNESVDELEAWLESYSDEEIDESTLDENDLVEQEEHKTDEPEEVETPQADSAPAPGESSDTEQVLLAKDGKNTIPYNVLESERTKNQTLQQRIDELEEQHAQSDKQARIIELRNNQLSKLGVQPDDLPEDITISDEEWDQYAEDYPELARPLRALAAKVSMMENTATASSTPSPVPANSQPTVDVNALIQSIPELDQMRNENGDDWQSAMQLDDQLKSDPMWQSRPINERFAEVARQVAYSKNEAARQNAAIATQRAIDNASNQLPNSPSEIGTSNSHKPSDAEFLANATAAEMQAKFMNMDLEEIEALLDT